MTASAVHEVVGDVRLPTFDLSYVIEQLKRKPAFAGWTLERFQKAEQEYRSFLALCKSFPDRSLGISPDGDEIWHRHILNTRRYIADCDEYFGGYFHHTPVCTKDENTKAQQESTRLMFKVFGINRLPSTTMTCVASGCMNNG